MKAAIVIGSGKADHPESGRSLVRITVGMPFTQVGEECSSTDVWADGAPPEPACGETIRWNGHSVWIRGVKYRKPEYDGPTNAPLH